MKRTFAPSHSMRRRVWWNRVKNSTIAECVFYAFMIILATRFFLGGW